MMMRELFFFSLLLMVNTSKIVEIGKDLSIESVDCSDADCQQRIYCLGDIPLYSKDFSLMWSTQNVEITFPESFSSSDRCLLIESEDTAFRSSALAHFLPEFFSNLGLPFFKNSHSSFSPAEKIQNKKDSSYSLSTLSNLLDLLSENFNLGNSKHSCARRSTPASCKLHFSKYGKSCFSYCGNRNKLRMYLTVDKTQVFGFDTFLPKKTSVILATSLQSLAIYFLESIREWTSSLVKQNFEYVVYYFIFTAALSLALTHYFLKKDRDTADPSYIGVSSGLQDIVYVLIKLVGLISVYNSTASVLRGFTLVILLVVFSFISSLNIDVGKMLERKIPRLRKDQLYREKFLSEEEYKMQGEIATQKELKKLFENPKFSEWAMNNMNRIEVKKGTH
eukprot:maker-scaffold_14-snap-gene-2.51-mRNA-1 protein AED:0.12 eAED:0.12 QI:101/0.5/0.33/1/1/1/3/0/391